MNTAVLPATLGLLLVMVACTPTETPTATPEPTSIPGPSTAAAETPVVPTATMTRTTLPPTPTATSPLPTATATAPAAWETFSDPVFGVTLQYPAEWQRQAGYEDKYAGWDGFFQLSAIAGAGADIDKIAESEAHHKLQPYGSAPTIETTEVSGQKARLILPSADQPAAMEGQAGLIVELPWQIEISQTRYDYLVLWADQAHIWPVAATLQLVGPAAPPTPTAIPSPTPLPPCTPLLHQQACWTSVEVMTANGVMEMVSVGYLVYLPPGYGDEPGENWPLVLFLHGSEERGDNPRALTRQGLPKVLEQGADLPFVVVSPQCPLQQWWWPRTHVLSAFLDRIESLYAVDSTRVYVTGLSMGGFGTWALAYAYPDRFAAIAPIAGGYYDGTPALPDDICKLKDLPTWAFHGAKDNVVLPDESERVVEALRACGGSVRFTLYPEAGHTESWELAYVSPELYEWLLQHSVD
jgi:predicted esterase